jgi:hypothetical protein
MGNEWRPYGIVSGTEHAKRLLTAGPKRIDQLSLPIAAAAIYIQVA